MTSLKTFCLEVFWSHPIQGIFLIPFDDLAK